MEKIPAGNEPGLLCGVAGSGVFICVRFYAAGRWSDMGRYQKDDRIVYRSLAMVTQFGLNMIVPIGIMSALGVWLDRKLGTSFLTIVLFAVGAIAGGQNIYRMAKRMCDSEEQEREQGASNESDRSFEEKE